MECRRVDRRDNDRIGHFRVFGKSSLGVSCTNQQLNPFISLDNVSFDF